MSLTPFISTQPISKLPELQCATAASHSQSKVFHCSAADQGVLTQVVIVGMGADKATLNTGFTCSKELDIHGCFRQGLHRGQLRPLLLLLLLLRAVLAAMLLPCLSDQQQPCAHGACSEV